jgi:S1-C subfamily serine protease
MLMLALNAGGQVTANVFSRVFQIRYGQLTGTAFIIDEGDAQYFVTAEHMVRDAGKTADVDVMGNHGTWLTIHMRILHGDYPCSDVAVLIPDVTPAKFLQVDTVPSGPSWFMGQEAYFLGFPYGLFTTGLKEEHPVPLMKHAYISAQVPCSAIYPGGSSEKKIILLDGMNNPGFSGGPVVAPNINSPNHAQTMVGVISGYKNDPLPLNVNGANSSNAGVVANSGIILAIPFDEVKLLIEADKKALPRGK